MDAFVSPNVQHKLKMPCILNTSTQIATEKTTKLNRKLGASSVCHQNIKKTKMSLLFQAELH